MKNIGVVHLIRAVNGVEPLARFLASYRAHPAGIDHRLVCVFKGFSGPDEAAPQLDLLSGCDFAPVWIPDQGFDLTAYQVAAERTNFEYYVFLNSFSEIEANDWLAMLYHHTAQAGVGVCGCTGSYETPLAFLRPALRVEGARAECGSGRRLDGERVTQDLDTERRATLGRRGVLGRRARQLAERWRAKRRERRLARMFAEFPNPHIRTNAFCLRRRDWLTLRVRNLHEKLGCWTLESGRNSLTRQLTARGNVPLVVGRDGNAYPIHQWRTSRTFRQGTQDNLLIADNRTQEYARADAATQAELERLAWGTSDLARQAG